MSFKVECFIIKGGDYVTWFSENYPLRQVL